MKPARVLTIAGSAAGGSAGIQADLKTFQELDVYGMSVVTAIVGRHPRTHKNVHPQTWEAIEAQFATALDQVGVDAMKTGMLFSKDVIEKTADMVAGSDIQDIVVDPVMVGKLDSKLLADDAIDALVDKLFPMATIITPNMPEASILLNDRPLKTVDDLKQAAVDLHKLGPAHVLVKGGRLEGPAVDILYNGEDMTMFEAPRIDTLNTSGAGCSYSAAITAYMAKGESVQAAVHKAKEYITAAIDHSFTYTDKVGPTYHAARRLFGSSHSLKVEATSL
ncbi:Hydroxymethylpyrimidine kinase [Lentibacillus sp. JNUCC-1]|uniref:bifunctional hydroxymethylpyrimidine kinase/phosphomethylpyrimidine kinase n=1 Tax=Lentibacillus sp. JNUCC-1 TaxID=2654513 RepID=UPI0012E70927|nr:bifunctional hydroxymethylpyrimidine kinase/phosphomethylpyrimidine kinase [Lentibacillus sp. JNUCC-1]MUV38447.1 Hydroxymethylpyrimidine kinase [Lentibacillus sp. JNUCC-1]